MIAEIEQVLAGHCGFNNVGVDFSIHYDIKYRMGKDAESDGEGEYSG